MLCLACSLDMVIACNALCIAWFVDFFGFKSVAGIGAFTGVNF
jgi:hypothetical protein